MTKNHLKARSAPRTWDVRRKADKFITRPNSGGQPLEYTLSLDVLLRAAGQVSTKKDVNDALVRSEVLVNGVRRHDRRFPVGLFDVVSLPKIGKHYTLTLSKTGMLCPEEIDEKTAQSKLSRVTGAHVAAGGKLRLRLSDGRVVEAKKALATGTTVRVGLPKGTIDASYPVEPQAYAVLIAGKHRGTTGTIESLEGEFVTLTTSDGPISTKREYAFVLGGKL